MHRRIACIALPQLRVEIAVEIAGDTGSTGERARERASPLAVIVARPGGTVQTERNILGNTRIDCVSREAAALGVRAGQSVAAARAKFAGLRVRVVAVGAVHTALARIAEAALAFGPTSAFDVTRDVVWVDVSGCAHLHDLDGTSAASPRRGQNLDLGEAALARSLGAHVRGLGHACCIAVADGPRLADAIARFSGRDLAVVAEGKGAAAVRPLPIAALELDADVATWLADLGLCTCGDLQKLPRRALGMRLGERVHDVMQLLDGRDPAPLDPWRPPEVPEERIELEWGAHSTEALTFVLKTLCDRLAARLHGRALAAARLELVLSLDRALCEPRPGDAAFGPDGRHRPVLSMVLPSPMARASDLLAVVRARLEGCTLEAPVLAVTLRAPELARSPARPLDLLAPEPKARGALPLLVAELAAELGEGAVGTLALVDTWSPTERTRLVPFEPGDRRSGGPAGAIARTANGPTPRRRLVTSAMEPSRLVHCTQVSAQVSAQAPREALAGARLLARVEANAWWQQPARLPDDATRVVERSVKRGTGHDRPWRHDLFAAWIDGALAWLELQLPGEHLVLRGWLD